MSTFAFSIQLCAGGCSQRNKAPHPHPNESIPIGKEELKLSLWTDHMILYGEIRKKFQTSFVTYAAEVGYSLSESVRTLLYPSGKQPGSTPTSKTLVNRDTPEVTLPGQHSRKKRNSVSPDSPTQSPMVKAGQSQQHKYLVSVWRAKRPGLKSTALPPPPQKSKRVGGGMGRKALHPQQFFSN